MPNRKYLAKVFIQSLNTGKKVTQALNADGGFEVTDISDSRPADLLIYDIGPKAVSGLSLVESLIKTREVGEVFLTSDSVDSSILMQAMRMGVKEFLSQPLSDSDLIEALKRFKERQAAAQDVLSYKSGRIITLFGSKGGVGTTTVAVNLSIALTKSSESKSVALVDMNTLFGEIPIFLEIAPKFHWGEITKNIERLDETFLNNVLTRHRSGIQVLPSPAYLNGHVRPTPEIMGKLMALMRRMFDYVVIDAGQSTNDTSLKVLEMSDTLLLVTILSLPCLANANKMIKSLTELGYVSADRIQVVLNRYVKKGDISIADAEAGLNKKLFCTIPNDFTATMAAINHGKPLLEIVPKAEISKSFIALAGVLTQPGEANAGAKKKGLLFN